MLRRGLFVAIAKLYGTKYQNIAAGRVEGEAYRQRVAMLQAAVMYEQNELVRCKSLIDKSSAEESPEVLSSQACILYKEEKYQEALEKFEEAKHLNGWQADLAYNMALCQYREFMG